MGFINREKLLTYLRELNARFSKPGKLYLIGETSLLFEEWRHWTAMLEFSVEIDASQRQVFDRLRDALAQEMGIRVIEEHPGDVIPLPEGFESRAIRIDGERSPTAAARQGLQLYHCDPYSVAIRFIARGDEQDYQLVLAYLRHGWINMETMDQLIEALLPRFSFKTIQQDPAEFRRKYKGLKQMYRAVMKEQGAA